MGAFIGYIQLHDSTDSFGGGGRVGDTKKVGGWEIYQKLIYERETCKKIYFPNFEHTNSLNLFI